MNTRTFKVASRTLTVLAIGTALTLGGASVAAASSRHGHDGGAQNGWGGGQQYGGQNGFGGWTGGQHANARGNVTAYTAASGTTAGSITIKEHDGTSVTFSTSSSTTITEVGGTGDTLAVGDVATVQAAAATPTVASSVWFFVAPTLGGFSPQNFSIASGNRDHHGGRLDARARFSLK